MAPTQLLIPRSLETVNTYLNRKTPWNKTLFTNSHCCKTEPSLNFQVLALFLQNIWQSSLQQRAVLRLLFLPISAKRVQNFKGKWLQTVCKLLPTGDLKGIHLLPRSLSSQFKANSWKSWQGFQQDQGHKK